MTSTHLVAVVIAETRRRRGCSVWSADDTEWGREREKARKEGVIQLSCHWRRLLSISFLVLQSSIIKWWGQWIYCGCWVIVRFFWSMNGDGAVVVTLVTAWKEAEEGRQRLVKRRRKAKKFKVTCTNRWYVNYYKLEVVAMASIGRG